MKNEISLVFPTKYTLKQCKYNRDIYLDNFADINEAVLILSKTFHEPVCRISTTESDIQIIIMEKLSMANEFEEVFETKFLNLDDDKSVKQYIKENLETIEEIIESVEKENNNIKDNTPINPDFLYSIADLDHVKEKLCDHCDQRIPDEPMRDESRD